MTKDEIDEEEIQKKFSDMSFDGKTIRSYLDGTDGLNFMCKCGSWLKLSGTVYENKQIHLTFKCDKCGHEERRKVAIDLTTAYDERISNGKKVVERWVRNAYDSPFIYQFEIEEDDDDYHKVLKQIDKLKEIDREIIDRKNRLLHPIKMLEKEITDQFYPIKQKNDMLEARLKKALSEYKIKKDKELEIDKNNE